VRVLPPAPIRIDKPFDAVTCRIYGNNWGYAPNAATPPVDVAANFADTDGAQFRVPLAQVHWEEWFLCHRRLSPDEIKRVAHGGAFKGFTVRNGHNQEDRRIFLAADFDKAHWREDAGAFLETCRAMNVLAALERSRSGNGGHIWLFFEQAIPAAFAALPFSKRLAPRLGVR